VTAFEGEQAANGLRPKAFTASRVASASVAALATRLSLPMRRMYCKAALRATTSVVAGVKLDSPWAWFFRSLAKSK